MYIARLYVVVAPGVPTLLPGFLQLHLPSAHVSCAAHRFPGSTDQAVLLLNRKPFDKAFLSEEQQPEAAQSAAGEGSGAGGDRVGLLGSRLLLTADFANDIYSKVTLGQQPACRVRWRAWIRSSSCSSPLHVKTANCAVQGPLLSMHGVPAACTTLVRHPTCYRLTCRSSLRPITLTNMLFAALSTSSSCHASLRVPALGRPILQYVGHPPPEHSAITVDLIYPATEKHVAKHRAQKRIMVGRD